MLPDYETCVKRINNYINKTILVRVGVPIFPAENPDSKPANMLNFRAF
jgi:hypothetical protein